MGKLISVIVPIYNVEKYLAKCLDSILAQTYGNLEIILINDGSSDRCGQICDNYKALDGRIKVIHKENGGLISAWRAGVTIAKGEYLGFVDSDDYIENDMFELLFNSMTDYNSDLAICGVNDVIDDKVIEQKSALDKKYYNEESLEFIKKRLLPTEVSNGDIIKFFRWNKLFKKNLFIENFNYLDESITSLEDMTITFPYLLKCGSISVVHKACYNYVRRESSMIRTTDVKKNLASVHSAVKIVEKECIEIQNDYSFRLDYYMANWILGMIESRANYKALKNNCRYLLKYSKDNNIKFDNALMGIKNKIKAFLLQKKLFGMLYLLLKLSKLAN